jgi:hypothetical protein
LRRVIVDIKHFKQSNILGFYFIPAMMIGNCSLYHILDQVICMAINLRK